jgi:hypothetical protein
MWTAWLRGLDSLGDNVSLSEPVDPDVLGDAEERLGMVLPEDLRSLLHESDGINGAGRGEPVWPVERIAEENVLLRSAGSTPALPDGADDDLLFFGDAGQGQLFAYELDAGGEVSESDVFLWQPGLGEAVWIASDLQSLLDDWVRGELTA